VRPYAEFGDDQLDPERRDAEQHQRRPADDHGGSITFDATQLAAGVLNGLKVTPANDTNFTLNISATEKDAEGNFSTATNSTELVTVNPTAPSVAPVACWGSRVRRLR